MTVLGEARLTVPEFAFVAGVDRRVVDREVDVKIIPSLGGGRARRLQGWDLFYLCSVKNVRSGLTQAFRNRLRKEIVFAAAHNRVEAKVDHFRVHLSEIERELSGRFSALDAARREHVGADDEVLGGEPVIKGTRLAVRHVADLVRQGATSEELHEEYDLTDAQVRAAVIYDQVTPRRGRPPAGRPRSAHVPAAR